MPYNSNAVDRNVLLRNNFWVYMYLELETPLVQGTARGQAMGYGRMHQAKNRK